MKLVSSTAIIKLENTINAIETVYNQLNRDYKKFFEWSYIEKAGIVKTCREVNISEKTYYRWKNDIIYATAKEFGLI